MGKLPYDRETVYLYMWEKCRGRGGMVTESTQNISDAMGFTNRTMQTIMSEFLDSGLIVKRHGRFYMMKDPELMKWDVDSEGPGVLELTARFWDADKTKVQQYIDYMSKKGWSIVKVSI